MCKEFGRGYRVWEDWARIKVGTMISYSIVYIVIKAKFTGRIIFKKLASKRNIYEGS